MQHNNEQALRVWVDTGGTFTDCMTVDPEGTTKTVKVLSNSSLRGKVQRQAGTERTYQIEQDWDAPDDFLKGFRFKLLGASDFEADVEAFDSERSIVTLDRPIPGDELPCSFEVQSAEEAPVLALRLITQIPPDRDLPPVEMRLATTKATNALLEEKGVSTALFVNSGFEDLLEIGTQQRPDLFALNIEKRKPIYGKVLEVEGRQDAGGQVLEDLDLRSLDSKIDSLLDSGISSAAVTLLHSYKNGEQERRLKEWLLDKGFDHVSISSELSPFIGILARAETTLVNAYLAPIIQEYLDDVHSVIPDQPLFVMTSAGGLSQKASYAPKDSLLSGPAGGVVGAAATGKEAGYESIISLDMGGTSTDVARYDQDFEYKFEHIVGNAHLVAPTLNIETVAAGGGSICYFDGHKLGVGPESAGAWPGPACYGAGGPLTLTDVNLLAGRLDPRNFHIPVDRKAASIRLEEMLQSVNNERQSSIDREELLSGFLKIANERMGDAIRKISVQKGYDTKEYAMVAFGGAGGQHACAIAQLLDMQRVVIPKQAGLLSTYGLGQARIEEFAEQQILEPLEKVTQRLPELAVQLGEQAKEKLRQAGISEDETTIHRKILSMRLKGQETALDIEYDKNETPEQVFEKAYRERYGHWIPGRDIEVTSMRVIASAKRSKSREPVSPSSPEKPKPIFQKEIWFESGSKRAPVFSRGDLKPGNMLAGPALILDPHSTVVLEPGWQAKVTEYESLELIHRDDGQTGEQDQRVVESEVIKLELFANRFTSIAEEMGEMLQRTALSVNVKDRLDFSCALLSAEGELVVNAPHIPVHLGALGLCVRSLAERVNMNPGDVVISNHPAYGGSHLPDVTVVTPIHISGQLVGYAASRAHHAEIGGVTPGSMPPTATSLAEEGVVIPPMHIVKEGEQRWDAIREHLLSARYPTRNVDENIADLQAAVAANQRAVESIQKLCGKYGVGEIKHYMQAIRDHAENKMRETIGRLPKGLYESEEFLDDGTPLKVKMEICSEGISIDFTGTGPVHPKNLNATPAIVNSVVMYVMRLLIEESIPLNEGILAPITLKLPVCLLNPEFTEDPLECPAVVGGNIEVSQRLVDTLLKPFGRIACSQGTMNNVLFGNERFGYYETVGGGTGAGPDFDGADAVHHHMTNTRGTDPEIMEYRYPVRLDRYAVRKSSGGKGQHTGGNGIVREMTFLEPVELTVLTQHRKEGPYGLEGGEPGQPGEQWVIRSNGKREKLESTDGRSLNTGDSFILKTPGGGGFGVNG